MERRRENAEGSQPRARFISAEKREMPILPAGAPDRREGKALVGHGNGRERGQRKLEGGLHESSHTGFGGSASSHQPVGAALYDRVWRGPQDDGLRWRRLDGRHERRRGVDYLAFRARTVSVLRKLPRLDAQMPAWGRMPNG